MKKPLSIILILLSFSRLSLACLSIEPPKKEDILLEQDTKNPENFKITIVQKINDGSKNSKNFKIEYIDDDGFATFQILYNKYVLDNQSQAIRNETDPVSVPHDVQEIMLQNLSRFLKILNINFKTRAPAVINSNEYKNLMTISDKLKGQFSNGSSISLNKWNEIESMIFELGDIIGNNIIDPDVEEHVIASTLGRTYYVILNGNGFGMKFADETLIPFPLSADDSKGCGSEGSEFEISIGQRNRQSTSRNTSNPASTTSVKPKRLSFSVQ